MPTDELLLCSICLEVFDHPVTLPCGHNFCERCITEHLNASPQRMCPLCNERVGRKHRLRVNNVVADMVHQYRESEAWSGEERSPEPREAEEVSSDAPAETTQNPRRLPKLGLFLTLGLVGLGIVFNISQEPHEKTHQMFDAVCPVHGKPLELYCEEEQRPICRTCAETGHRSHHIVPLKEAYEGKKEELWRTLGEIDEKIQRRQQRIQEVNHWVWESRKAADQKLADVGKVFLPLMKTLEEKQAEVTGKIEAKHEAVEKQAEGFKEAIERDISELMERSAEVKQLSRLEDHLHFLQSVPFLNIAPLAGDDPQVSLPPESYEGLWRTAVHSSVKQLIDTAGHQVEELQEAEHGLWLKAVDVTLDPETAHPLLVLSDDGKQVHVGGVPKNYKTFVFGKQSFSGRFYYDVQVKGKVKWVLGVVHESVKRERRQLLFENDTWALLHGHGNYFTFTTEPLHLPVNNQVGTVRVLVDYEEGLVSFYDLDAAALIYSFTGCSFTERLCPIFNPIDSHPLVLPPVVGLN
ncbi:E3 ubiquitin-protein ligase TRIM21-like [Pungitius pungitius]|uniref:E3 ubiquitin-protein ligase TRIM21-like n=1 Tax=Pungitius pungitius TaxID=134920 RepID=UPI002E0DBDDC